MGMKRVRAQGWKSSPDTFEPWRQMSPTVAGKNKWARIEALQRSKGWLVSYKDALARFVAGVRDVVWPPGTWWMCARLGCRAAVE